MKRHVRRFRVKRLSRDDLQNQSIELTQSPSRPQITATACHRCRQLKRKCSRTPPECEACEQAGVVCSLAKASGVCEPSHGAISRDQTDKSQARFEGNTRGNRSELRLLDTCKDCGGAIHSANSYNMREFSTPDSRVEAILDQNDRQPGEDFTSWDSSRQHGKPLEKSMVDAYFRDAHRAYPFLDQQQVTTILDAHLGLSKTCSPVQTDMLTLVMAIGATSLSRSNIDAAISARFLSIDYERMLRSYEDQENIESLEVLILLTIFSGFDPRRIPMRPLMERLVRSVVKLGLNRRKPSNEISQSQREKGHRLFWSIYSLDRIESLSLGTPVNQVLTMQGIPLPSIAVEEFNSTEYPKHVSTLQVAHHLIRLRRLEEKVLVQAHLYGISPGAAWLGDTDREEAAELLRIEIDDWYSGGCLLTSTGSDDMALHIRISWLTARYYNLLILLYYPSPSNKLARLISTHERAYFARKYIHCLAIAHHQQQLPLNLTTLFRLLPVLLLLVDYLATDNCIQNHEICETKSLLRFCSELLRAFPLHWEDTRQAAKMLDDLEAQKTSCYDGLPNTLSQRDWEVAMIKSVAVRLAGLALTVLGADTAYLPFQTYETYEKR